MSPLQRDCVDGARELDPVVALRLELAPPTLGEAIHAPFAPPVAGSPPARDELLALQPVKRGIERALGELERSAAAVEELVDDAVAVRGPVVEYG